MIFKVWELISIIFSSVVGGMYWGPWLALTRSLPTFEPAVFITIVRGLNRNMEPLMTFLTPAGLLLILPVMFLSYGTRPLTFYFTLAGFLSFVAALIVTMLVEVPIVKQIVTWTDSSLPNNWQQLRDRWGAFHVIRVASGIGGLILLVIGALF
jgi:uncharacterized membrane protein